MGVVGLERVCVCVCVCTCAYLLASRKWIELSPPVYAPRAAPMVVLVAVEPPSWLYHWLLCLLPVVPLSCAVLMLTFVLQPLAPVRKGLWPGPAWGSGQG